MSYRFSDQPFRDSTAGWKACRHDASSAFFTARAELNRKDHRARGNYANKVIRRLDVGRSMKARSLVIQRDALSRDACQPFDCTLRAFNLDHRWHRLNAIQLDPGSQFPPELWSHVDSFVRG